MKQEVDSLPVTLVSEEEHEPNSPRYIEDNDSNQDGDDEEGPIDLRKKPNINDRNKMVASPLPGPERRSEDPSTTSAEALLDIWQRTLLTAGIHPYLSPLLFLGGTTANQVAAAKSAQSQFPYDVTSSDAMQQAPIVCDPFGGRHLVMRSQDGNVVAVPLGGAPPFYEHSKDLNRPSSPLRPMPVRKSTYAEQHQQHNNSYTHKKQTAPISNRGKSELVSRLESAPVVSRMEYESQNERQDYEYARERLHRSRDIYSSSRRVNADYQKQAETNSSEPEDLSVFSGSSEEEHHCEEGPDHRRWAAASSNLYRDSSPRMFRSKSCSELPAYKSHETTTEDEVTASGQISPVSMSCPSLAAASSSHIVRSWHTPVDHLSQRKRKLDFPMEEEDDESMDRVHEDDEEGRQRQEIINAPITRLLNPRNIKPKIPRLIRIDGVEDKLTHKSTYYDAYEDYHLKRAQLAQQEEARQHCLTPEQEETFLERLRHSAPLGVPWNVYSYYTQMMQNLTDPHLANRGMAHEERDSSLQRPDKSYASSVSPSPATTPVPVSPPMVSSTTVLNTTPNNLGNHLGNQDSRKVSRVLTGKHVRQGTGASPSTLMTLRQKIQERQRAKEMSFQTGFGDGREATSLKNSRELKKRNHSNAGVLNKGR